MPAHANHCPQNSHFAVEETEVQRSEVSWLGLLFLQEPKLLFKPF